MAAVPATRAAAAPPALALAPIRVEPQARRLGGPVVLATALAVAALTVLFGALIGTLLVARESIDRWPPEGASLDLYVGNVIAVTAIMAVVTALWARWATTRDDTPSTIIGLVLTLAFIAALTNVVWWGVSQVKTGVDSAYGNLFFAIHGAYLLACGAGIVLSLLALLQAMGGQYSREEHATVTATCIYSGFLAFVGMAIWYFVWVLK